LQVDKLVELVSDCKWKSNDAICAFLCDLLNCLFKQNPIDPLMSGYEEPTIIKSS
jgi:hypothetical protein